MNNNKPENSIIQEQKKAIMQNDKMSTRDTILSYIKLEIETVVNFHTQSDDEAEWNLEEIYEVMDTIFPLPIEVRIDMEEIKDKYQASKSQERVTSRDKLIDHLCNLANKEYEKLEVHINGDEKLKEQLRAGEKSAMSVIEKTLLLRSIDTLWVEHIDAMDHMRRGIGLRSYGQKDPLVEYKKEARRMFDELLANIRKQVVYSIFKVGAVPTNSQQSTVNNKQMNFSGPSKVGVSSSSITSSVVSSSTPTKDNKEKVGRNDLCPCGSGKKYKKCCGK